MAHQPPVSTIPGFIHGAARRSARVVLTATIVMLHSVTHAAEPAPPVPLPITITATSGPLKAGMPITISWRLDNPSSLPLIGSVVYYLNGKPLNGLSAGNPTQVDPHSSTGNTTYQFDPIPGWNEFRVLLLDVHGTPTSGNAAPILSEIAPGQSPPAVGQQAAHPKSPEITLAAEGTYEVNASPHDNTLPPVWNSAARKMLLHDYAPLLLYSYDHGSDEQYAPIDVVSYVKGATLSGNLSVPNSILKNSPLTILNPTGSASNPTGTIAASQSWMPVKLFVGAPQTVEQGLPWSTTMQQATQQTPQDVGLYGHITVIDPTHFRYDADPTLPARIAARYHCQVGAACDATILKIEYWQFFGYSYDFYKPVSSSLPLGSDIDALAATELDHGGDWCSVQLFVDASWWNSPRKDQAILAVYHYFHGYQAGFDMSLISGEPSHLSIPDRKTGDHGAMYLAAQYAGPEAGQEVKLSIKKDGHWIPPGWPDMATELAHAQNSTLQLAAESLPDFAAAVPGVPGHGSAGAIVSYQHPVVYVEWGGHEFWPTPNWQLVGASKHNGLGQYSYFGSAPTDLTIDRQSLPAGFTHLMIPEDVALVTTFAGYWGPKGGSGPPPGPPLHVEWYWDPDPNVTPPALLSLIENIDLPPGAQIPSLPY